MNFLRALNEELTHRQRQSPHRLPTLNDLKSYLEKQFGQIEITGNQARITVTLPKLDVPEIIEDRANRALRAFGLNYTDLSPGKETGMTRKFTIYSPEITPTLTRRERRKKLNDLFNLDQDRLRRTKLRNSRKIYV